MRSSDQLERELAQRFDQTVHQPSSQALERMARYAAKLPSARRRFAWPTKAWVSLAAAAVAGVAFLFQAWPSPPAPQKSTISSRVARVAVADNTQFDHVELNGDDLAEWFDDGDGLGLLHVSDIASDLDALAAGHDEFY